MYYNTKMPENNLCRSVGCNGACCRDITIYDDEDVLLATFPKAKEVNAWQLQKAINGKLPEGTYYQHDSRSPDDNMALLRVVGPCEHLSGCGDCTIHDRCSHAALNFEFDSEECKKMRGVK